MLRTDTVAELRAQTASAHAALEDSDFILPATVSRERYARLVGAMFSFHVAIEREFRRFERDLARRGLSPAERYKAPLLHRESNELMSPRVDEPLLEFGSVAHAAGGMYVMEGSTLGGTIIAKSVRRNLDHVSAYYGCYGEQTARRWSDTTRALNAFAWHDGEIAAMVAGATATFQALHEHLARVM